jgi:hypothetical protein
MDNKPKKKPAGPRKSSKKPSPARKIGYIFAIAFMILAIYVLRHLREWGVTWLNEDFEKCLFYIELSIYVSIAAQVLFILYDNRWFKHLIQGISNVFGALSIIMIYVIFPFNFGDAHWVKWLKIGLLIVFVITVISIIVEIVKGIRYLINDPEKE